MQWSALQPSFHPGFKFVSERKEGGKGVAEEREEEEGGNLVFLEHLFHSNGLLPLLFDFVFDVISSLRCFVSR